MGLLAALSMGVGVSLKIFALELWFLSFSLVASSCLHSNSFGDRRMQSARRKILTVRRSEV